MLYPLSYEGEGNEGEQGDEDETTVDPLFWGMSLPGPVQRFLGSTQAQRLPRGCCSGGLRLLDAGV